MVVKSKSENLGKARIKVAYATGISDIFQQCPKSSQSNNTLEICNGPSPATYKKPLPRQPPTKTAHIERNRGPAKKMPCEHAIHISQYIHTRRLN